MDRRIFSPLSGTTGPDLRFPTIEQVQFTMRVDDLAKTIDHYTAKVIQAAGWSQATFSEHTGDTDVTATEIRAREKRTLTKRGRRISEEQAPLKRLLGKMLTLDGVTTTPTVEIEWPATVTPDAKELAETAQLLRVAGAASRWTLVQMVHPEWTDGQIGEEVARMLQEEAIMSPTAAWEPAPFTEADVEGE